jgi:hypothetical protein
MEHLGGNDLCNHRGNLSYFANWRGFQFRALHHLQYPDQAKILQVDYRREEIQTMPPLQLVDGAGTKQRGDEAISRSLSYVLIRKLKRTIMVLSQPHFQNLADLHTPKIIPQRFPQNTSNPFTPVTYIRRESLFF